MLDFGTTSLKDHKALLVKVAEAKVRPAVAETIEEVVVAPDTPDFLQPHDRIFNT